MEVLEKQFPLSIALILICWSVKGSCKQSTSPANDGVTGTIFKGRERSVAEKRLREQLLIRYDKPVMPNANNTQIFMLKMGMILTGIQEVDCNKQRVTVSAWMKLEWYDGRLTWFPDQHANLSSLPFSDQDVYIPEVQLFNRYKARDTYVFAPSLVIGYFHGELIWLPPSSLDVPCSMDMSKWPFDSHICVFIFGHASRDSSTFQIYPDSKTVDFETGTGVSATSSRREWYISDTSVERTTSYILDNYDTIRFYLTFTRVPSVFLRSCFMAPHVLLITALFLLCTDDANVRHLMAVLQLVTAMALGATMWMIIPPARYLPKIAYLTSGIPVVILTILIFTSLLDRLAQSYASVPRCIAVLSLCLRQFPGKLFRRERPRASGQLLLTDGPTLHQRPECKTTWTDVAAQLRVVVLLLYTISCAFLIGLTYN
ncbi:acetylcholine receptor subunit beta-like 2 [Paramacrobiotus metropolitanus]|uniref:acetylcholine receptor subunit beta-like 2 n=1 Tax=Paramacrobiotus metropolitanus TaxID=2943436 RepID=UPI00244649DB|nr:acetylcholine receptor subunit beta-like 2 [Paramacrobiotus metropolitanus]